jgi:hypothetical protein
LVEASAGVKTPKSCPGEEPVPGALGAKVDEQPATSLFQTKRDLYEDDLLVRRAMREGWPVPARSRESIPVALGEVVLKRAPAGVEAGSADPLGYFWKVRHRLAAVKRLLAMQRQNLENVPRARTMQDVVREVEELRRAKAGRSSGRAGPAG